MSLVEQLLEAAHEMPDTDGMSDREVLRHMAQHYDGGFWAFVSFAIDEPDDEEVGGALSNRFGITFAMSLLHED